MTGVDLSQRMAHRANQNAPAGFRAQSGDLEQQNLFSVGHFDGIIFGQVLHHFPNPERVLKNCALWLQPQGWLVIVEPNGANPVNKIGKTIGTFLRRFSRFEQSMGTVNEVHVTPWALKRRLRKAGFQHLRLELLSDHGAVIEDRTSIPLFLRLLMQVRDGMYVGSWRLLPRSLGATTLIARAQVNGSS